MNAGFERRFRPTIRCPRSPMSAIPALVRDLVVANRILARENVVDAYGHVSVRHPDDPHRFLLATSVAPEMVEEDHIVEFNLDCTSGRAS